MEQFEEAMAQYASAEAQEASIIALLDEEMARIRAKYTDELTYLQETKKQKHEVIYTYCREQKEKLFSKRRSIGTIHGAVGFRLGNPKLKTLRGTTWGKVIEKLKEQLPDYVRTTDEPAKDLLLADRSSEKVAPLLQEVGLQIVQEEIFYIELKKIKSLAA